MDSTYEKITGFGFWDRFMYLISNSPLFVIALFILIVVASMVTTEIIFVVKQKEGIFKGLYGGDGYYESNFGFWAGIVTLFLTLASLVVSVAFMFTSGSQMAEENIEKNIIAKYGFSDAELWGARNVDQGVYLVTVFDKEKLKSGLYEFWFDAETHEPNKPESNPDSGGSGISKLLNRIDELSGTSSE